jgi:uncharacterized membrane protein HdeD (DUF308 family)
MDVPIHRMTEPEISAAMSERLAQNWWVVALRGAFAVLFGLLAFVMPVLTIASLVLLFGAFMLVDGGLAIVAAVRAMRKGERWKLLILEGAADIAAGIVAFAWPAITVLVFVAVMAAWAVISGVLMVAAMYRLKQTHGRWMLGLGGAVSIVFGLLLIAAPAAGAIARTWWLGVYALIFGATMIALGLRLRREQREQPHRFGGAAAATG